MAYMALSRIDHTWDRGKGSSPTVRCDVGVNVVTSSYDFMQMYTFASGFPSDSDLTNQSVQQVKVLITMQRQAEKYCGTNRAPGSQVVSHLVRSLDAQIAYTLRRARGKLT